MRLSQLYLELQLHPEYLGILTPEREERSPVDCAMRKMRVVIDEDTSKSTSTWGFRYGYRKPNLRRGGVDIVLYQ